VVVRGLGVVASRCRSCDSLFPLPLWIAHRLPEAEADE
jgi:hypothetical protein